MPIKTKVLMYHSDSRNVGEKKHSKLRNSMFKDLRIGNIFML